MNQWNFELNEELKPKRFYFKCNSRKKYRYQLKTIETSTVLADIFTANRARSNMIAFAVKMCDQAVEVWIVLKW
jgi:hypothetical protein